MTDDTETQPRRGPGRPPLRTETKRESLRDRLRGAKRTDNHTSDKFGIAAADIPEGVSLEWKKLAVYGQEDPFYIAAMRRQGWEPMLGEDFPNLVPEGHQGSIIKEGMILMGRPSELTEAARNEMKTRARQQVRDREIANGKAPDGTLPRPQTDLQGRALGMQKDMMVPIAVED